MKKIKTFESFINEAKSIGIIYHYTSFDSLEGIIEEDRMESSAVLKYISFSRNPLLNFHGKSVRITFNGDVLSNKFHVEPFMYDPSKDELFDTDPDFDGRPEAGTYAELRNQYGEEREERITKTEIKGIKKAILAVELIYNKRDEDFEQRLLKLQDENPEIDFTVVNKFTVPAQMYHRKNTYQNQ